jgi:hypothetical protein
MENYLFCGQCGVSNPKESNFCFSCGQKLIKATVNITGAVNKPDINSDYPDIQDTLLKLIKASGYSIISIGDYYVQFSNNLDKKVLYFEAVSSVFLPALGDKDKEFKKLGFEIEPNRNYFKIVEHNDFSVDQIIQEIKTIFETIYNVSKLSSYQIEIEYDD